ncbi:MAG TPA: hypothetical protein VH299_02280 [Solirubrobacterales bacterium]|jgi:hypothetical protein|nr:hypothetical protein [Solirubrobacterales bacterium]
MSRRLGDAAVAIVLAVAVVALLIAARADGRDRSPSFRQGATPAWSAGPLPVGWHEVYHPLTGVLLPVQVFASATYPIVLHHRPGECGPPRRVLAEMPAGGILLQVIEYPPRAPDGHPIDVPRLPRRPDRFSWADASWGRYECAGPSFKFDYRQAGHALQAQVWMHPATVDPRLRAGALRILDNLR